MTKLAAGKELPTDSPRMRQSRLGWLSISNEIDLATHVQTWKVINYKIPEEVAAKMTLNNTGKRIQQQRKLPHKTKKYWTKTRQSDKHIGHEPINTNTLPGDITLIQKLKKFKKTVKKPLGVEITVTPVSQLKVSSSESLKF